jgi:hypothetical protein
MILKASQRGGGQDLAAHLMRLDDNEHVSLHELRGFAADDLKGAFKEAEAVSRGTACTQYLFSLSLNPPEQEHVPIEVFELAIERIEERLGLQGQPRAIVIHEKNARVHAHCVWSRIDAEAMTARQLSFFKTKLQGVSRELYLENGWKLPRGLENAAERNPTNFTLAEWQQAKRQEIDPRWLKSTLQDCWQRSDNAASFQRALQDRGFFLARGDKRGFVVLDHQGEVWSLPKMLDLKTKDVRARLGTGEALPSVAQTQKTIGERMVPHLKAHVAESRTRFAERAATLGKYKSEMTLLHREAREKLKSRQKSQWNEETIQRTARLPKGIRGLWHRITGKYQQIRRENEAEAQASRERQAKERDALIAKQLEQRAVLQAHFKELRARLAKELLALRADIGRFLSFTRGESIKMQAPQASIGLKLQR